MGWIIPSDQTRNQPFPPLCSLPFSPFSLFSPFLRVTVSQCQSLLPAASCPLSSVLCLSRLSRFSRFSRRLSASPSLRLAVSPSRRLTPLCPLPPDSCLLTPSSLLQAPCPSKFAIRNSKSAIFFCPLSSVVCHLPTAPRPLLLALWPL